MNFLKKLFGGKKEAAISNYADFWKWFRENERGFHKVVKEQGNIEQLFLDPLGVKLNELKDGFYFLTGMFDEKTAELIITAEGQIKNFVFVEELIAAAPPIPGWRFTAHKPEYTSDTSNINMAGYAFNCSNLSFYANEHPQYPDEIDIVVVYDNFKDEDKSGITNGVYIFLDNYLGELNFAINIDRLQVTGKTAEQPDHIPLTKLKDYLKWRQKEFVEKYEDTQYTTENDNYAMMEATLESGNKLLAVINTDILDWDGKASHPWILNVEIEYDGERTNGMPGSETYERLNEIEDAILEELSSEEGYLNIGRQTAEGVRDIYFACKEFRKPSKVLQGIRAKYAEGLTIDFAIYKDKYWQAFNRFKKD